MKKILIFTLLIFTCLGFISCDDKKKTIKNNKNQLQIAMVSDNSNINDQSFHQSTWKGIVQYANEKKLHKDNYSYKYSNTPQGYLDDLSVFAKNKPDLIIAPGFNFKEPVDMVSDLYPEQKILLLDAVSKNSTSVSSITFASNEGSFLVGLCASLKANDLNLTKVGFLGGLDIPLIQEFEAGFIKGVKTINPKIEVIVKYANSFAEPKKGQEIAKKMYDDGVKIIFHASGSTGTGLIKEAKKRAREGEEVWVVGVDKDQFEDGLYKSGKSVVLTSMVKKLDVATYDTIVSVKENYFEAGHKIYSLKNDGVGIPKHNPNLKKEWVEIVNKYKIDIIKKEITIPNTPKRIQNK